MNWDAIGAIGEAVGATAVLVTLAYLAVQVRQNSRSVRASIEQATAEFVAQVLMNISATPGLSDVVARAFSNPSDLDEAEVVQFWSWLLAVLRAYEQAHHQYLEGNVSESIWSGMDASINALLNNKFVEEMWRARRALFNPRFQSYVDALDLSSALPPPNEMIQEVMKQL